MRIVILLSFLLYSSLYAKEVIHIGVLAKRGEQKIYDKWSKSIDYLNETIDCCSFELLPLPFEDIHTAIKQKKIHFILANPAYYVALEKLYGVTRIATLKNLD
ncbi:MAG: sensor histidine kinase, partial [Campylobacterota bacterium]|nr:sensor histidine kinase [Campylobacterota bacterium]